MLHGSGMCCYVELEHKPWVRYVIWSKKKRDRESLTRTYATA